jgi:hypothetical protein
VPGLLSIFIPSRHTQALRLLLKYGDYFSFLILETEI